MKPCVWMMVMMDEAGRIRFKRKKLEDESSSISKDKVVASKTTSTKATKQASATESPKETTWAFKRPWDK